MEHSSSVPSGIVEEDVVLFAVPKKGRIHEDVMKLLNGSGLEAKRPDRLDVAKCKELPVKLVFLPAADIPAYVMEGDVDLGISGQDMLEETLAGAGPAAALDPPLKVLMHLGIGKCKLCVQAPRTLEIKDARYFVGKRIVTSFPNHTRRFFNGLGDQAEGKPKTAIKVVSGSVEAACGLGLADAVVDLVETGTTMRAAGLEVVGEPIAVSEALLFQQVPTERNGLASGRKAEVIRTIEQRINGYLTASRHVIMVYNCHTKDLAGCCAITPGKRSPTVTALRETDWHSVSALVPKESANSIMDRLKLAGAQDVLCMPLSNTRM